MHLAAVRWIATLLRDEDEGLLATIVAGVPGMPDDVDLPLVVQIADETRKDDSWVAYGTYPETVKAKGLCLVVRRFGVMEGDVLPNGGAIKSGQVAMHMLVPKHVDGVPVATAVMQGAFILRAAERVIKSKWPAEVSTDNPVVFGTRIVPARDAPVFASHPLYDPETLGGGVYLDALLVTVSVDDNWANGFAADTPPTA
ncbi:MAG: hypothetical protein H7099_15795 [Gemmatimonadaceae bacterium]|nr:hypothetical protein [Gemmatimonadaceae bacterium]